MRFAARDEPRAPELPPSTSGSTSARTSGHAPCSLDCVIANCRLSANRPSRDGSFTPRMPGVRPLTEYPGCATTLATGTPAARSRRSASRPERGGGDLRLHVRAPPAVVVDELGIDGVVPPHRRRHAAEPHHPPGCPSERREQRPGEREVAEDVRREDELVPVPRGLAAPSAGARCPRSEAARRACPRPPTVAAAARTEPRLLVSSSRVSMRSPASSTRRRSAARAAMSRFGLRPVMNTRAPARTSCSLAK